MPVLRGLTDTEVQTLGCPSGTCEVTSAGAKTANGYSPGRWRDAKTYLLPPDPTQPGKACYQMHIGRDVHYEDDGGNWRNIDLNWQADPTNPGEFITDRNDFHTRVTRFGVAVWDRKRKVGVRWSTTARPSVGGSQASFPKDGLSWAWSATTHGLKLESEPILAPRGPQTYEWRYLVIDLNRLDGFNLAGTLTPDSGGNLVGDGFVTPRAYAIGANGVRYDCGKWQAVTAKTRAVAFAFDDSTLPPEAFPYVIDPTTTFAVAVATDDGSINRFGASVYPPDTATGTQTAGTVLWIEKSKNGSAKYRVDVSLLRVDTGALPDAAILNSASIQLQLTTAPTSIDGRNLVCEYYPNSNWPIDDGDYTDSVSASAFSVPLSTAGIPAGVNTFPLANVSQISTIGYTGFRIGIDGGAPNGDNTVGFGAFEHATAQKPRLIVDYTGGAAPVPLGLGTATVAGVSSITSTLSTQALGPVTIAGTSTVTASLVAKVPLSASIAGTSSLSASPVVRLGLSAAIGATSTLSAVLVTLTPFGPVAISATSGLAAGLGVITPLSATIAGTSGLAGNLAALVAMQAQIAGLSSLTASLTTVGTLNPVALAATIAAASTVAADPIMRRGLSAQIVGDSTIAAAIAASLALSAQIDGLSTNTAGLVVLRPLSAQIGAQASIDAALAARVALAAAITGSSSITAALSAILTLNPVALSAVLTATATLTAAPIVRLGLSADIAAVSGVTASLEVRTPFGPAAIARTSGLTAELAGRMAVSAVLTATTTLTAAPIVRLGLSADIAAVSGVTAPLEVRTPFGPAAIAGTSGLTADLAGSTLNPVALSAVLTATGTLTAAPVIKVGRLGPMNWEQEIQRQIITTLRAILQTDLVYTWDPDVRHSKIQITSEFPATEKPLGVPHVIVSGATYSFPRPSALGHLEGDITQNGIVIGSKYRGNSSFNIPVAVLAEVPAEASIIANMLLDLCLIEYPVVFESVGITLREGTGGGGGQLRATTPTKQFQANIALQGYFHWVIDVTPKNAQAVMERLKELVILNLS